MRERAFSTVLGYVLALAITTVLISGLLFAGGGLVDSQQKRVIDSELTVVGDRVAGALEATDRLVSANPEAATVRVQSELPERVASRSYTIEIRELSSSGSVWTYELTLSTSTPDVSVSLRMNSHTEIQETTVDGGTLTVQGEDTDGDGTLELVVSDD